MKNATEYAFFSLAYLKLVYKCDFVSAISPRGVPRNGAERRRAYSNYISRPVARG